MLSHTDVEAPLTAGLSAVDILYRLTGNAVRATKIRRELCVPPRLRRSPLRLLTPTPLANRSLERDIQDEDTAAYFYAFKEQHVGSSLHELEQHQGSSSDPQQPRHHEVQLQQDELEQVESPAVKARDLADEA